MSRVTDMELGLRKGEWVEAAGRRMGFGLGLKGLGGSFAGNLVGMKFSHLILKILGRSNGLLSHLLLDGKNGSWVFLLGAYLSEVPSFHWAQLGLNQDFHYFPYICQYFPYFLLYFL